MCTLGEGFDPANQVVNAEQGIVLEILLMAHCMVRSLDCINSSGRGELFSLTISSI